MTNAKPTSYFFADPATFSQEEWRAFGPRGDNGEQKANQFSLSSAFGSWSTTNAYAVCKGVVFLQPQKDSEGTTVNLVLRPIEQPFPGVKVKYFVYRGMRKEDFFDNDKVLVVDGNTSDFINKINTGFASFYTSRNQQVPDFLAKYIGYDPANQAENLLLDDFFFKQATYVNVNGTDVENTTMAFELPLVQGGASLGRFASDKTFAMDVVLDYGDFRETSDDSRFIFNLAYVRSWRAELNFWWLNDPGVVAMRPRYKEQIFQFIDILAFYGAHADGGVVKAKIGGTWYNKTATAIYTDLLNTSHGKNRWYFYIQSDRTRSYNFYGNYVIGDGNTNNLKKGYAENAISEAKYTLNDWPIMIDEGWHSHGETTNNLFLQFTKTPNNQHAMCFVPVGYIANAQDNNFCNAENLSMPDGVDGTVAEWTRPLHFKVPVIAEDGFKKNISSFAILLYQGRQYAFEAGTATDENNVTTPVYAIANYFDEVFDGLDALPLLSQQENPIYSMLSNQRLKLISQYYNRTHYGIAAVQTTRITDAIVTDSATDPLLKRVTYIAESVDTLNNAIAIGGRINNGAALSSSAASSASDNNTYRLPEPFYYERQLFTDGTTTVTGLTLKTTTDALPDRIIVGVTETEHNTLKALILTHGVRNARLFLLDLFEDGNELISAEGTTYQKYRLGIVAEVWEGPLKLFMPAEDVIVYAIDRYYYYTEGYSKYVKDPIDTELAMDLDIAL